jgi:hypothetical protein
MSTRLEEILLLNDEARERIWRASIDFVEKYLTTVSDRAVAPRLDLEFLLSVGDAHG